MVGFQSGEQKSGTLCSHAVVRFFLFAGMCLAGTWCFAADAALPNISANDNRTPAGRLESGVLTLRLELREGLWHPEAPDGLTIDIYSFAEEGHEPLTPGPLIRVPQGTELRVSVHNRLPVSVFVHGLHAHPGKAEDLMRLAPDETKEARFAAGQPGSYIYWASTSASADDAPDMDGTMSGAFLVNPSGTSASDRIFVIQLWDRHVFDPQFDGMLAINGKSWPYTERLHARLGHPEHWHIVNASRLEHPMHLHGFYFHVDAMGDGETERHFSGPERRMVVTQLVEGGHTFDMTWEPERVGNWIFHCHILDHMSLEKSPVLYGPAGVPAAAEHAHQGYDSTGMGMAELVLGITVRDDNARLMPVKAVVQPAASERRLFIRERPAKLYVPAGPGFYLEGVSQEVGAVGPPLVITRGERTAIIVVNELNVPTAIHWHGMEIESYYDGVPGWDGTTQRTTPAITPGSSFVAYMTPPRAGTFIYHTHWHDMKQLTAGMYGALLVLEPGQKYDPATDKVFVLGRCGPNEMHDPLVLNGSPQPGVMVLLTGQTYRFRFINITPSDATIDTSLTSEGHPAKWRALAKDGAELPPQRAIVLDAVQPVSVGETYDFEFTPKEPGDYALRFSAERGSEVTQVIAVVPPGSRFSVFAAKR